MHNTILSFLILITSLAILTTKLFSQVSTLDITYSDLETGHEICGASGSCKKGPRNISLSDVWIDRNCLCDKKCSQYGDCCVDSNNYEPSQQRRAISSFSCVSSANNSVYMKKWCPPYWKNVQIRRQCELSNDNKNTSTDPLLGTPVTSLSNGTTYGNVYCAHCNSDDRDLHYWQVGLQCPNIIQSSSNTALDTESVRYNATSSSWQIEVNNMYYDCAVTPNLPRVLSRSHARPCVHKMIKSCAPTWTNANIRDHCEAYTSVVYNDITPYRNIHCGICNNVPVQNLSCKTGIELRIPEGPTSFTVLFDFKGGTTVGMRQPCQDNQLYDPFFKKCRDVFEFSLLDDNDPKTLQSNRDSLEDTQIITCPKYTLSSSEYVVANQSIFVPKYKKSFDLGSYTFSADGTAVVCVSTLTGKQLISKYKPYFGVLTIVGIGVSILCLGGHLLAFTVVQDLRNLSGMNLASFCVALLVAYCSFIVGDIVEGRACFVNAVVTYYFFLAAFFWMLTIAFDVWRALRIATSELRINTGKQWKKFAIYSCWSWLMPANVVLVSILVEMSPKGYISEDFHPNFGTVSCWFGRGEALLVFLGIPLSVIMAFNVVFFVSSFFMIYSSQSMTVYSASSETLKNFKLFSRLALIMGLTWITGLIGGMVDNEIVWVIFILLNTLEGLFVFIGFTCRRRVLKAIKEIHHEENPAHLPTVSSSSATSSDMELAKSKKSAVSSTTNTTSTYY